jgi:hypothetical protein
MRKEEMERTGMDRIRRIFGERDLGKCMGLFLPNR